MPCNIAQNRDMVKTVLLRLKTIQYKSKTSRSRTYYPYLNQLFLNITMGSGRRGNSTTCQNEDEKRWEVS